MKQLKAYHVKDNFGEGIGVIVFHKTASKAKKLATRGCEWFIGCELTNISAKREPAADHLSTNYPSLLNFCNNADFYQSIGWVCSTSNECGIDCCIFNRVGQN